MGSSVCVSECGLKGRFEELFVLPELAGVNATGIVSHGKDEVVTDDGASAYVGLRLGLELPPDYPNKLETIILLHRLTLIVLEDTLLHKSS